MSERERRDEMTVNGAPDDSSPSRRGLIRTGVTTFGLCYGGSLAYPVYRYLDTPAQRAAGLAAVTEVSLKEADALELGAAMMFRFGSRPAVLIHHQNDSWVALDAVCTHLGCTVQYQADKNRIFCACHGGVYDPGTGEPVAGPPPKGLTRYTVEVRDGEVIVGRS